MQKTTHINNCQVGKYCTCKLPSVMIMQSSDQSSLVSHFLVGLVRQVLFSYSCFLLANQSYLLCSEAYIGYKVAHTSFCNIFNWSEKIYANSVKKLYFFSFPHHFIFGVRSGINIKISLTDRSSGSRYSSNT